MPRGMVEDEWVSDFLDYKEPRRDGGVTADVSIGLTVAVEKGV